jgi:hypothetical protein
MTLAQSGGAYAYNNGRIRISSVDGNVMTGEWEQSQSSRRCADGRYYGRFRLEFDRRGFSGGYGYCDAAPTAGEWNGTRPIAASAAPTCRSGFVWREARSGDYVCVSPESRARVHQENATAPSRVDPTGASGPMSCISGYVWREAFDGDVVCVTPDIRALTRQENALASSRTN